MSARVASVVLLATAALACLEPGLPTDAIHVVVGGYQRKASYDWLKQLGLTNATVYVYIRENPELPPPPDLDGPCNMTIKHTLLFPNYGRDSAAFYDYIVRHYHRLPKLVIFLHEHGPTSWHTTCHAVVSRVQLAYERLRSGSDMSHALSLTQLPDEKEGSPINTNADYTMWKDKPAYASCLALFTRLRISTNMTWSGSAGGGTFMVPKEVIHRAHFYQYVSILEYALTDPDEYAASIICFEFGVWMLFKEQTPTQEVLDFYATAAKRDVPSCT